MTEDEEPGPEAEILHAFFGRTGYVWACRLFDQFRVHTREALTSPAVFATHQPKTPEATRELYKERMARIRNLDKTPR